MNQLNIKNKIRSRAKSNEFGYTVEEIGEVIAKTNEQVTSINTLEGNLAGTDSANLTANSAIGRVVSGSLTAAAGADETITILNSTVTASTVATVVINAYAGAGTPVIRTVTPGAGQIDVVVYNVHATLALNATMTLDFATHGNVS